MPWYRMRGDIEPCDPRTAGTLFHMRIDRRNVTPPSDVCGYIATRQCDRIVDHSVFKHGEPLRCDRWICRFCAFRPEPNKDLCPQCVLLFKAWLAARTNSIDGAGPG